MDSIVPLNSTLTGFHDRLGEVSVGDLSSRFMKQVVVKATLQEYEGQVSLVLS